MIKDLHLPISNPGFPTRNAYRPTSIVSPSSQSIIPPKFLTYSKRLVLDQEKNSTAFTQVMYVRIVTEICQYLGMPTSHGVSIEEGTQVGDRLVSIRDVIVELKGVDGRPYKSAKTFGNYRTWVNKATTLLSRMESEDPGLKQSHAEIQFRRHVHDLLQTPLAEALSLNPSLYGLSSDFCNRLEQCRRVSNRLTLRPELIPSHIQLQQI